MLNESEIMKKGQRGGKIKVVLLGDRGVGKSSIIHRFITGQFEADIQPTVGVDFMSKHVKYNNKTYRIELWDTAGQQKYRSLVKGYLKSADVCIFVYDCSSIRSLTNLPEWLSLFTTISKTDTYKIIVANKCDTYYNPADVKTARETLKQTCPIFTEISEITSSAKLGINIDRIFEEIIQNYSKKQTFESSSAIKIDYYLGKLRNFSKKPCCER